MGILDNAPDSIVKKLVSGDLELVYAREEVKGDSKTLYLTAKLSIIGRAHEMAAAMPAPPEPAPEAPARIPGWTDARPSGFKPRCINLPRYAFSKILRHELGRKFPPTRRWVYLRIVERPGYSYSNPMPHSWLPWNRPAVPAHRKQS